MPKLRYTKNSIGTIIKKAEQGIVLTKKEQEAYQFMVITGEQIKTMVERINEAIQSYVEFSQTLTGVIKEAVNLQKGIAEQVRNMLEAFSAFRQINILVQIPRLTVPTVDYFPQPIRIFVQPDEPYTKPKSLPSPNRKRELSITSIKIVGNGFMVDGGYIKGMTRKSKTGQLFELMLRADLKGVIPDELIDRIVNPRPSEIDYRARGFLIRDLKDILFGNKLKLNIERYRAFNKYIIKGLVKHIRSPRKIKRVIPKTKIN